MTAILAILANDGHAADEAVVTRMLGRMGSRGGDRACVWREGGVVIAISRHEWEFGPDFSGPVLVVQDGDHVIAADASLYYRNELGRKLVAKGVRAKGDTPSHLILAAYQAFGENCPEMLEGDFSFIIWDRRTRRVTAARDFGGKRPLYYAELNNRRTLVAASSIGAILEHPECPNELNLPAIAITAANIWSAHTDTSFRAIYELPAAHTATVAFTPGVRMQINRHWVPPVFDGGSSVPFDAAAIELRELICRATDERLGNDGPTSVWMSGGADSPAVFGSGKSVLERSTSGRKLVPISISYPEGDRGREDELIISIAERWGTPVHWIDSAAIQMVDRPAQRAASRDEPFAHAFEMWNRALAAGSRTAGARVALDGNGGDQLFFVSDYYLSDLFKAGALRTLRSHWRMKRLRGFRTFWEAAVQPQIPDPVRDFARTLRLERLVASPFDRFLPAWMDQSFAKHHELLRHDRRESPRRRNETHAEFEARWFLTHQYFPRVFSLLAQFAIENGTENRSPLYDRRVIAFAAGRPRSERSSGRRTKRLLAAAMRGLLPDRVLAPRSMKTGITRDYFARGFAAGVSSLVPSGFDRDCRLADLGIVNHKRLLSAINEYERSHDNELAISLFLTLQTELWLRARDIGVRPSDIRVVTPSIQASATNAA